MFPSVGYKWCVVCICAWRFGNHDDMYTCYHVITGIFPNTVHQKVKKEFHRGVLSLCPSPCVLTVPQVSEKSEMWQLHSNPPHTWKLLHIHLIKFFINAINPFLILSFWSILYTQYLSHVSPSWKKDPSYCSSWDFFLQSLQLVPC